MSTPTKAIMDGRFVLKRMNAFKQSYVAKRLIPLLVSGIAPLMQALSLPDNADADAKDTVTKSASKIDLSALGDMLSKLDDKDIQFIYDACLAHCYACVDGTPIRNPLLSNGVMVTEPTLQELLTIVSESVIFNFEDFFA